MLEVISQSRHILRRASYVRQIITKLLRLMLVASDQARSTFLDFAVFPLYRQKFSNLGQHDVGYAGVATGRGDFNLPS